MTNRPWFLIEALLWPLAVLYAAIVGLRGFAYHNRWLKSFSVDAPVLSIGNLTAGGTGKTPLTALIVSELQKRDCRVGIVSRGYGGKVKGVERVAFAESASGVATYFGDEPTWYARNFPKVPVYVGPDRVSVAKAMLRAEDIQFIVADDAFQHRRLRRSIDIVVIDATEPRWHYRSLPLGRLREGFSSLRRAHVVFLTKVNLASREQVEWLDERIRASNSRLPVYKMESAIRCFVPLAPLGFEKRAESFSFAPRELRGRRLLLVSGIGRPSTFEQLVREQTEGEILEHVIFRDHHEYSEDDRVALEKKAMELKADLIVVTEKDAVKLESWKPRVSCLVSRLEVRPLDDLGAFYEDIRRLVL